MAKLILTQEVTGLGAAGDVVEVKNGYARNYLLPRGFALTWTRGGEKQVESIKAARAARQQASLEAAQAQAAALSAKKVVLKAKAGVAGRLFGTIKPSDVVAAVEAAGLGSVDKRSVQLPVHIKSTGSYTANVRLHDDVTAVVNLEIVASK
ncbi:MULTISPECIES: 50S ribosomal protein L9 [Arthrobacter]|jgi:large subunit ribosomal protein L9|uniref:Large ribosomal subunit protein bL9 n=1 Tax=Arthrobacter woluwensis TaxID=156980 RepID=A0A1H4K5K5_9MICC|nr:MULTISPECIES: 50S ribosomal protein L9 [Arthrobacter]MBO9703924.1 50S ribosomal protein L9 [Arthrobacter sp.]PSS44167.1 50S ribosomal protein L9 [Arthrobacter woluwensis]QTF72925.1 50S ribosomal protein L9 [Arthrobacter woluwensis]WFR84042.1 50S ribosomal protein L9 [Arthrobacter sp. Y-9]SEB53576.1 LSU ribosomal protein L9P [Arthrobacter woluwensis]